MGFKDISTRRSVPDTPETLFRDLRARAVEGLLSQQADILREYASSAVDLPDVALHLPTGSGKTLVGMLIAEWRRRKFKERAVYLCPTRQLVHQVAEQAMSQYGLKVTPYTGSKANYDPHSKSAWVIGDTVAVTSYSALFNRSPFFAEPHLIILDDAHAAENYISRFWSLEIPSSGVTKPLFDALCGILRSKVDNVTFDRLARSERFFGETFWVDKLPGPIFLDLCDEIRSSIDEFVETQVDMKFRWPSIRDNLHGCHLFMSTDMFLLRPLVPPTESHSPFANAVQRIYMSATLGDGGELERITGRRKIHRLSTPRGYETRLIGRRFFLFPECSLAESDVSSLVSTIYSRAGRTLHLVPSDRRAAEVRKSLGEGSQDYALFSGPDLENKKSAFVNSPLSVAVVANRYDGIDLPHDECRSLIVDGLPTATNLQERFIVGRLGAAALLQDRIVTRIVQAFGRCTRSSTDYSAVIVLGEELGSVLLKEDQRKYFDCELQAELEFGIQQSRGTSVGEFTENLESFLDQTDDWLRAEAQIVELRTHASQAPLPGRDQLARSAPKEVEYVYALWRGDFLAGLEAARGVIAELVHPDLRGYRGLWKYLAGCAAEMAGRKDDPNLSAVARRLFRDAANAAPTVDWLLRLSSRALDSGDRTDKEGVSLAMRIVERIEQRFTRYGFASDRRFARDENLVLLGLDAPEATQFEEAHRLLGEMLGYHAGNSSASGAPDPYWLADRSFVVVFEDYSDAQQSTIGVDKARQVATHPNWCYSNLSLDEDAAVLPVIVGPVDSLDKAALPHLQHVKAWHIEQFRQWARNGLHVLRELRRSFPGQPSLTWRADAAERLMSASIAPRQLAELLDSMPALALPEKQLS